VFGMLMIRVPRAAFSSSSSSSSILDQDQGEEDKETNLSDRRKKSHFKAAIAILTPAHRLGYRFAYESAPAGRSRQAGARAALICRDRLSS